MPPSLSTVVFCWLEAHRRASFPEELDQAVSESRSPDSGPTTPTPEPPIAFGRFPRYTGKLPRLTGTTALFYRFPRYTGKLPRMAGTSAACIRERFVLREKFTVAGTATVYKVSRCSELGQFDCSPNPEDLHGPLSGVLPLSECGPETAVPCSVEADLVIPTDGRRISILVSGRSNSLEVGRMQAILGGADRHAR